MYTDREDSSWPMKYSFPRNSIELKVTSLIELRRSFPPADDKLTSFALTAIARYEGSTGSIRTETKRSSLIGCQLGQLNPFSLFSFLYNFVALLIHKAHVFLGYHTECLHFLNKHY